MKQKLLLSLFALLLATTVWGDLVINKKTFPDKNFRNWVLSQEYGADGLLTDEEIARVKSININSMFIGSLKGIEHFPALTELNCAGNYVSALNVSKNTMLTKLDCSSNKLTELDVSKNTALTNLNCSVNWLTTLDVSKNTALIALSCNHNQLSKLNLLHNTELDMVFCNNNLLTTLNVSQNNALRQLYCYQNQINGAAMDALVESLPTKSNGSISQLLVIYKDWAEHNVMTEAQVAAAKAKGWISYHLVEEEKPFRFKRWQEYEGSKKRR